MNVSKCKKLNQGRFLEDIHPDAFKFIVRYGVSYHPKYFRKPPQLEPLPFKCFENAQRLMLTTNDSRGKYSTDEMLYVEGIVFGAVCDPMLHAWNTTTQKPSRCTDWTFYSGTHWIRYFGIPFSESDYRRLLRETFPKKKGWRIVAIFGKNHFAKLRPHLEMLLNERCNYELTQGTA